MDPLGAVRTPPLEPAWIEYSPPPPLQFLGGGGSTFFVPTGSGSRFVSNPSSPMTPTLPDLPFPRSILLSSPTYQTSHVPPSPLSSTSPSQPQPPTPQTLTYAPVLPRPNLPPSMQTTTKVPLAQSSSILAHSGFWDLLSATGSRFYSPSKIETRVKGAREEQKHKVRTERIGKGIASKPVGSKEPVEGGVGIYAARGGEEDERKVAKEKRRVSKDLIGEPRAFA